LVHLRRDPLPRIPHRYLEDLAVPAAAQGTVALRRVDLDFPLVRELDGVRRQVKEHLHELTGVEDDAFHRRFDGDAKLEALRPWRAPSRGQHPRPSGPAELRAAPWKGWRS